MTGGVAVANVLVKREPGDLKRKAAGGSAGAGAAQVRKVADGKRSPGAGKRSPGTGKRSPVDSNTDEEDDNNATRVSSPQSGDEMKTTTAQRRRSNCHFCQSLGSDCGLVAGKCPNRPCNDCGGRHRLGRCRKKDSPSAKSTASARSDTSGGAPPPALNLMAPPRSSAELSMLLSPFPGQGFAGIFSPTGGALSAQPAMGEQASTSSGALASKSTKAEGEKSLSRKSSKPNLTLETSIDYVSMDPLSSPMDIMMSRITPRNMRTGDSPLPSPSHLDSLCSLVSPNGGLLSAPFFPQTPMNAFGGLGGGAGGLNLGPNGNLSMDLEGGGRIQDLFSLSSMRGTGPGFFTHGFGQGAFPFSSAGLQSGTSNVNTTISPKKVASSGAPATEEAEASPPKVAPKKARKALSINTGNITIKEEQRAASLTGTHSTSSSSSSESPLGSPNHRGARQYTMLRKRSACHYCSEIGTNCGLVAGKCPNRPCKACDGRHRHGRCRLKKTPSPAAAANK